MRFTEKIDKTKSPSSLNDYIILGAYTNVERYCQAVDKFGQYEDNDEKLGIDYNTFIKVLDADYVYCRTLDRKDIVKLHIGSFHPTYLGLELHCFEIPEVDGEPMPPRYWRKTYSARFYVKDYGKTWALTREELL